MMVNDSPKVGPLALSPWYLGCLDQPWSLISAHDARIVEDFDLTGVASIAELPPIRSAIFNAILAVNGIPPYYPYSRGNTEISTDGYPFASKG